MIVPALLIALLTLPFHPFWIDMELVRRAWLLCLCGALCLLRPGRLLGPPGRAELCWLLLVGWSAAGTLWSANPWEASYRVAHLAALFLLLRWGRSLDPETWLLALLPTAVAVSVYGLLQHQGLDWPRHYASSDAPVSTLGNLNVASELTALGAVAGLLLCGRAGRTPRGTVWPGLAIVTTCAYLVVNGSLSGLLATAAALLWILVTAPGRDWKILAVSLCLLGAGLGRGLSTLDGPAPATAASPPAASPTGAPLPAPAPAGTGVPGSTAQVRLELWKGCLPMTAEAPVLGHGPGQFRIEYPRFRTQAEIELSTLGRQFRASPHTAHNDPLELLVEGGVPGLGLALAFLAVVALAAREQGLLHALAPLVCFAALGLVRSPLGNAPVAAVVMVHVGALLQESVPGAGRRWARASLRGLGGLLLIAGLPVIVAQSLAAPYVPARAEGHEPDADHLRRALAWWPFDIAVRELLVQEALFEGDLPAAERHLEALAALAPHSPFRLLLSARAALLTGDLARAEQDLDRLADLDPGDLEAAQLRSTVHFRRGEHRAAIDAVYDTPHPRMRAHLPEHLRQLEQAARDRGDPDTAALYACERSFLDAVQRLRAVGAAQSGVEEVVRCFGQTRRLDTDLRPWLLMALQLDGLDDRDGVEQTAREASQRDLRLAEPHRSLLADLLPRLQDSPGWRAILDH